MKKYMILMMMMALGCSEAQKSKGEPGDTNNQPNIPTEVGENEAEIRQYLTYSAQWDVDDILAAHPFSAVAQEPADLTATINYDLIDDSSFKPTAADEAKLIADRFVVMDETFPSFTYGYVSIYGEDLPIYISLDSILSALHRSFDDILKDYESRYLREDMLAILQGMRQRLVDGALSGMPAEVIVDIDEFLAVGLGLLDPNVDHSPVAGGDGGRVDALIAKGVAAATADILEIFGSKRDYDWSQMKPRGHYEGARLEQYFRATMWFGRTNLDMLAPEKGKTELIFDRRQTDVAMGLGFLFDEALGQKYEEFDQAVGVFIGIPDSLSPSGIDAVQKALNVTDATAYAGLSDATVETTLKKYEFGKQQILSQIVQENPAAPGLKAQVFNLFPQRYTIDSHVFSRVVHDVVEDRMMPDTLDVAFAVFQNNQALAMLEPQLQQYQYAPELETMWALADLHDQTFWAGSLYTAWLSAIREASPGRETRVPTVAKSAKWGERILNTQLASWAELRHDTLLYTKQSYTSGNSCEFPDAYVDPYPAAYAKIARFGELGAERLPEYADYFNTVIRIARMLESMAEHELTGQAFTPEMMEFVNQAVSFVPFGCGDTTQEGWYADLMFNPQTTFDFDPTIADVHTQPTDEVGTPVGKVLHVATGGPRKMIVIVDQCDGPRAYAGVVSSYFEHITNDFQRLDDQEWATMLNGTDAPVPRF